LTNTGALNGYAFALGDPISRIDPGGELAFLAVVAIAVVVGALVGVAAQVTVDIINVTQFDGEWSSWQSYAGAAAEGAIAGFITAVFAPASVGALALAGGVSALGGNLTKQVLRDEGEEFDLGELAFETAFGAAFGAAAGKLGNKLTKGLDDKVDDLAKRATAARKARMNSAKAFNGSKKAAQAYKRAFRLKKLVEVADNFAENVTGSYLKDALLNLAEAGEGSVRGQSIITLRGLHTGYAYAAQ
jgi:hypothetical protein